MASVGSIGSVPSVAPEYGGVCDVMGMVTW
jgi:hypothetical protein